MPPGDKVLLRQNRVPGDRWRMKLRAMEESKLASFPDQGALVLKVGCWQGGGGG